MTKRRLFLDHAAGSPTRDDVIELMAELQRDGIGNPNGGHAEARRARSVLDAARASLADDFGVESRQITFTATASEALALGLHSALQASATLVTTRGEHRGARALAAQHLAAGGTVRLLPLDAAGSLLPESVDPALAGAVGLLSLASGEVGTIQPWPEFLSAWRAYDGGALVVDGVQAAGHDALRFESTGAAHLAVGSAKVGGPFGVAALISAPTAKVRPLLVGGGQERGRRGGTEAVVLAAGFAAAHRQHRLHLAETQRRLGEITAAFDVSLGALEPLGLAGHRSYAASWLLGDDLVAALDHAGIAVSTGSACISGSREPSEALLAMGLDEERSRGGLRISFGATTTLGDASSAGELVRSVLSRIRTAVPS